MKYGIKMSDQEKERLLDSYPGWDEGQRTLINIQRLYEMRHQNAVSKTYNKVKIDESDSEDEQLDLGGYFGQFYREKQILQTISANELFELLASDQHKFAEVIRTIKGID